MDALGQFGLVATLAGLAAVGVLLGGAIGHWRRGRGGVVSGAVIGGVGLPLAALSWLLQVWLLIVGAVVVAVLAALSGFLG